MLIFAADESAYALSKLGVHLQIRKHTIDFDQKTQHVQITDQPMAPSERDTRTIRTSF